MPWAKLDDSFHAHPSTQEAWEQCPASVGLYAMALSYSCAYLTDGRVPFSFVKQKLPRVKDRTKAVAPLLGQGLWTENGEGYWIRDFLDFNPSREEVTRRRESDRKRKGGT